MNIFFLDENVDRCAEAHMDSHVGKMVLESVQLLCNALWIDKVVGYAPRKITSAEVALIRDQPNYESGELYKIVSYNHPCAIWARTSLENYEYLWALASALGQECRWRGFNEHKSYLKLLELPDPAHIPSNGLTMPALAMEDDLKTFDPIESYRSCYIEDKARMEKPGKAIQYARWTRRNPPEWWWANKSSVKNYLDAKALRDNSQTPENQKIWQKQMDDIIYLARNTKRGK